MYIYDFLGIVDYRDTLSPLFQNETYLFSRVKRNFHELLTLWLLRTKELLQTIN